MNSSISRTGQSLVNANPVGASRRAQLVTSRRCTTSKAVSIDGMQLRAVGEPRGTGPLLAVAPLADVADRLPWRDRLSPEPRQRRPRAAESQRRRRSGLSLATRPEPLRRGRVDFSAASSVTFGLSTILREPEAVAFARPRHFAVSSRQPVEAPLDEVCPECAGTLHPGHTVANAHTP